MTGLEIAALISMLGGTAMQYKAANDASKRATQETLRSLARQDALQRQAEKKAMDTAQEFAPEDRAAAQDQIEAELTEQFINPVESAQQINNAQTTTQGNVSGDYTAAKAKSNVEQMKVAQALARLMGKTTAAGRLRTNEALKMSDAASDIDRLSNFSRGQLAADQVAINAAARPDAGMMYGGQLLSGLGSIGLAGGFNGLMSAPAESGAAATVADWSGKTGGIGVKADVATGGFAGPLGTAKGGIGFKVGNHGISIPNFLVS